MLSKERIKEAETNVKSYLSEGLIKKESVNADVLRVFLRNAEESIASGEKLSSEGTSDLWVIVCSYYSMFYIANAVLRKLGYKVGEKIGHKVTADALIVYVRGKLKESLLEEYEETKNEALALAGMKADSLIESFDFEKNKRGSIQYGTDDFEKESKAKTSLQRAKTFFQEMKKFLIEIDGRTR
ncbi:MAG: HEPN domain-containing protein [Nanoarchaeota archaeon]